MVEYFFPEVRAAEATMPRLMSIATVVVLVQAVILIVGADIPVTALAEPLAEEPVVT